MDTKVTCCWHIVEPYRAQASQGAGAFRRPMSALKFVASDSGHDSVATDAAAVQETPASSPRAPAAMNDTGKVTKVRPFTADPRTRREDVSNQAAAAAAPSMDDFQRVGFCCISCLLLTQCGSASEMTYIVSGGALNSTHSLT